MPKRPDAVHGDAPGPNPSYVGVRRDILALVPAQPVERVLDVGCASGATSAELKRERGPLHVTGIEYDADLARIATTRLDRVLVGDANARLAELVEAGERFDLVLCGDVLEHLVDPWAALSAVRALCPTGHAIVSLPNIAHLSTFRALLAGRWPYRERGIHDRTHLRFFGRNNLAELFAASGFSEVRRVTHHRLLERPHALNVRLEPVLARLPLLGRLTEYQFVCLLA
jgi:2-polyprenyl-3-methyl-5-hydroxy-6-metoxy-1,4-benzoquinol methylase